MRRFIDRLAARVLRRWRRNEEGAAAVEFALVSAAFFWLFMGIIELGMLMLFNNGLEDGVERASRLIRTGQVYHRGISAAQLRDSICQQVVLRENCRSRLIVDVRAFPDFASIRNLQQPRTGPDGGLTLAATYRPGAPRQVVLVRAFYEWKFFTPLIGRLLSNTGRNTFLINAATAFRNEPFGT